MEITPLDIFRLVMSIVAIILLLLVLRNQNLERNARKRAVHTKFLVILKMCGALNNNVSENLEYQARHFYLLWKEEKLSTEDISREFDRQIEFLRSEGVVPIK